jgi:hypothetical protein
VPAKSKQQYRFFKAIENNPEFAKSAGVSQKVAKEYTKGNKGKYAFSKLKERIFKKS